MRLEKKHLKGLDPLHHFTTTQPCFLGSLFVTMFSLKHILVVSLAFNVSLVLRMMYESEIRYKQCPLKKQRGEMQAVQQASLVISSASSSDDGDRVVNFDHGDPKAYEKFWRQMDDKTTVTIPGWQSISYFSDVSNICWFMEPEFASEVVRLHKVVGNAVTEGRHIVVGTGSSQLFLAALYALSPPDAPEPISVVSAAPYYSSYPLMTDYQKSGLYKWGGDAKNFDKEGPYIELVTSPNNPDGFSRQSVVNRSHGVLVHDLAYYWPQYTPISSPSDHDLTLFTVSKSTGHAGMRIGWALVKDEEVAKKMTQFIEISTIGVSKDSQLRASKVLRAVSESCEQDENSQLGGQSFFNYSYNLMVRRWEQLRAAVEHSGIFSLPNFSPSFCNFFNQVTEPHPAFAWLKCERGIEDCASFLREHKILTRSGKQFGVGLEYVRISMLDTEENFILFVDRISAIN